MTCARVSAGQEPLSDKRKYQSAYMQRVNADPIKRARHLQHKSDWEKAKRKEDPAYRGRIKTRERNWRQKKREQDPEFREKQRAYVREYTKQRRRDDIEYKKRTLVNSACSRIKKRGLLGTIKVEEIAWPTHCPVFPWIELDYLANGRTPNSASLDRRDNTKGYVPGNVFVISLRANALKKNATAEELRRLAEYAAGALCDPAVA